MKLFFFDLETTGLPTLDDYPQIIEFCGALYDTKTKDTLILKNGNKAIKTQKYKPLDNEGNQLKLDQIITQITGIRDDDLIHQKPFKDEWEIWDKIMRASDRLVAHNAAFDIEVYLNNTPLNSKEYRAYYDKTICTANLAKEIYGEYYSLNRWYKEIFKTKVPNHHQAFDDVMAMVQCYKNDPKMSNIVK